MTEMLLLSKRIFSLIAEYNVNPPPPFFVAHSACRAQASRYHDAAMAIVLPIEDMERCIENLGDILETYAYRYEKMEDTKDGYKALYADALARIEALEKDYHELIYAVATKYEGETRHQTALRYITEREMGGLTAALAKEKP
jgi:hypothetical protein